MENWLTILAKGNKWQNCYPIIARETRKVLEGLGEGETLDTRGLINRMWPEANEVWNSGSAGRSALARMGAALRALLKHELAGCATLGMSEPVKRGGWTCAPSRPAWFWHRPTEGPPATVAPNEYDALVALVRRIERLEATVFAMQEENEYV